MNTNEEIKVSYDVMKGLSRLYFLRNFLELNMFNIDDVIVECFTRKNLKLSSTGLWIRDNPKLYKAGLKVGFRT
jgi:hypothetical protein